MTDWPVGRHCATGAPDASTGFFETSVAQRWRSPRHGRGMRHEPLEQRIRIIFGRRTRVGRHEQLVWCNVSVLRQFQLRIRVGQRLDVLERACHERKLLRVERR